MEHSVVKSYTTLIEAPLHFIVVTKGMIYSEISQGLYVTCNSKENELVLMIMLVNFVVICFAFRKKR